MYLSTNNWKKGRLLWNKREIGAERVQKESAQDHHQTFCVQWESATEVQLRCGLFLKTLRLTTRFSWKKCWFQSGRKTFQGFIRARKVRSSFIWTGHVRTFIPTLPNGWKQTRLNTILQDTGQPTPQICLQWITKLIGFLKIQVIVEPQGPKANLSKWRMKCSPN